MALAGCALAGCALTGCALTGCEEPAPTPTPSASVRSREPRPSTQGEVRCDGASVDPPELSLLLSEAAETSERIRALEALAGAHPSSATVRTRLGEQLLRTRPPSARRAATWFARALSLHAEGCALGPRDHWASLEGAALSRMMQGDYAGAQPILQASLERWPGARATRYNLACVQCQTGDVDGCAESLESVLDADSSDEPAFLDGAPRPRAHYERMAGSDPDLSPLRAQGARFEALIGAHLETADRGSTSATVRQTARADD